MRVLRVAGLVLAAVDDDFLQPKAAESVIVIPKETPTDNSVKKLIETLGIDEEKINEMKERAEPIFQSVLGQITDLKKRSENGETRADDPPKMLSDMFGIDEEQINKVKEQLVPMLAEVAQNLRKIFQPVESENGEKLSAIGQLFKMVQNSGVLAQEDFEDSEDENSEDKGSEFGEFVELARDEENLKFDIDILNTIAESIIDDLPFTLEEVKTVILNEANQADEFGNKDGKVSLVEVVNQLKGRIVERVDDDEDGSVSRQELRKAAAAVLDFMNLSFSDEQIDELYRVLDKDQDGDVTLEDLESEN